VVLLAALGYGLGETIVAWQNSARDAKVDARSVCGGINTMPVTLTIADDLARELKPYEDKIAEILTLGMREWQARGESGYAGLSSVLETLAALPEPAEVLALRPARQFEQRLEALLEKHRTAGFSSSDQREWDQYEYVEHLVRLAKINAARKLKGTGQ
jgi:hypothetical protein